MLTKSLFGRLRQLINNERRLLMSTGLALLALGSAATCGFAQPKNPAKSPSQSKWKFDSQVAWDYLIKQCEYGPRVPGTPAQEKCKEWLRTELKKGCPDAHVDQLSHHWAYTDKDVDVYNVVGTQNWEDAQVRVVLLAHWDSRPWSDGPNSPLAYRTKPFPYKPILGANDGASGVAVLLELAQELKDRHPGVGILYLLDDAEDLGPDMDEMLVGVDYFAKHLPSPRPDYGILLDMIGKKDTVIGEESYSLQKAPKLTQAFYANAQEIGLGKTFPATEALEIEDDHWPLIEHGVPTLDLIDFDYPQWHTQDDTPAHCSKESLGAVGIALESFLLRNPPFKP